ncbi:MAG: hypothetical protein PUP93_29060 [Rhizonema sp. NSF051]|nr:hypothetical protein [Rhizonema sp. NSF051]
MTLIPARLPNGEIVEIDLDKFEDFLSENHGKIMKAFRSPFDNRLGVSVYDTPVKIQAFYAGFFVGLFEANQIPEANNIIEINDSYFFITRVLAQDSNASFIVNVREPKHTLADTQSIRLAKGEGLGVINDSTWKCHQVS